MFMRLAIIAFATVALALAACGEGAPELGAGRVKPTARLRSPLAAADPQRLAIMDVLARYERAIRARDAATICTQLLSRSVRRAVDEAGSTCERELIADAIARGGTGYRVIVRSIALRGDRATAHTQVSDRDGTEDRSQPLIREDGRWALSG